MGISGISPMSLLIILLIVALIFGTKKLKGIGGDLGGAVKGFKKALTDDENKNDEVVEESKKESTDEESTKS